jgi:hypothetical protein
MPNAVRLGSFKEFMKEITFSAFKQFIHEKGAERLSQNLPLTIMVNCEPAFIIDRIDNVIPLSDMHPRMKNILRQLENRARMGMPKKTITKEDIVES